MNNDNSHCDNWGHIPGDAVFWERSDGLMIVRHCEGIFSLRKDGVDVMPHNTFEAINAYLWAEFEVMGEEVTENE